MRHRRFYEVLHVEETKIDGAFCHFEVFRNHAKRNQFDVAFVVAPNKKLARACFKGGSGKFMHTCLYNRSTGKSGLKPLLWAQQCILAVLPYLRKGDTLFVSGTDEQRNRAYARLLRYGFERETRYWMNGEEELVYAFHA